MRSFSSSSRLSLSMRPVLGSLLGVSLLALVTLPRIIVAQANEDEGKTVSLSPGSFQEIRIGPSAETTITLANLTSEAAFGVVQANCFLNNVTISYNHTLTRGYYATGSNVGLVVFANGVLSSASVYLTNPNPAPVQVLVGLQTYDSYAPIPGGCNMELSTQTAPYLPATFTKSILTVVYPLASWPLNVRPATCDRSPLQYDIYQYYLPEKDASAQTVFRTLRLMSDVASIEANGRKVGYFGTRPSQIQFANYIGTGRIVVVIVRGLTASAAYVPTVSYGCVPGSKSEQESCELLSSTVSKLFDACLVFVGLFLTFLGHRFYQTQLFILGFCITSICAFLLLVAAIELDITVAMSVSIGIGAVGGACMLLIWARWGAPVLPVFLACLVLGVLFGSIIAYTPLADYAILKDNSTFWLAIFSFVLVGPLVFFSFAHTASIVFTAVLGSYLFIVPIDHYAGSNLMFIFVNMVRRATVGGFGSSIVDPPFQTTDLILTVVWAGLAAVGTLFQLWREKGRAPFPPPPTWPSLPRRPTTSNPDEASPLLP